MKKAMLSLTPRVYSVLKEMAKRDEISLSELVRRILNEYLERKHGPVTRRFIKDPDIFRQNSVFGKGYVDKGLPEIPYFMGVDVGLKSDGSAITIGHWDTVPIRGVETDVIVVDCSCVRYAEREGRPYFTPEEIAGWIAGYCEKFNVARGLMDQYYGLTVSPCLREKGIDKVDYRQFTRELNSEVYLALLHSINKKTFRVPCLENGDDSELVKELLSLVIEEKEWMCYVVSCPEELGGHDDLSDSLARMVYLAHEWKKSQKYSTNTESK